MESQQLVQPNSNIDIGATIFGSIHQILNLKHV